MSHKISSCLVAFIVFCISLSCGNNLGSQKQEDIGPSFEFNPVENFDNEFSDYYEIKEIGGELVFSSRVANNSKPNFVIDVRVKANASSESSITLNLDSTKSYEVTTYRNGAKFFKTLIFSSQLSESETPGVSSLDIGTLNSITTYFSLKAVDLYGITPENAEYKIQRYFDGIFETEIKDFSQLSFYNFKLGSVKFKETHFFHKNKINILSVFFKILDSYDSLHDIEITAFNKLQEAIPNSVSSVELRNHFSPELPHFPDTENKGETLIDELLNVELLFKGMHIIGKQELSDIFWDLESVVFFNIPTASTLGVPSMENNSGKFLTVTEDGLMSWGNIKIDLSGHSVTELYDIDDEGSQKIITSEERDMLNEAYSWGDHSKAGYSKNESSQMIDTGNISGIDNIGVISAGTLFGMMVSPNIDIKINYIEMFTDDNTNSVLTIGVYDSSFRLISSGNLETDKTGFLHIPIEVLNLEAGMKYYFSIKTNKDRRVAEVNNLVGHRKIKLLRWKKTNKNSVFSQLDYNALSPSGKNIWLRGGLK
jgi:hypothetical protein